MSLYGDALTEEEREANRIASDPWAQRALAAEKRIQELEAEVVRARTSERDANIEILRLRTALQGGQETKTP